MKKFLISSLLLLIICSISKAQEEGIQKGDNEITFNGIVNRISSGGSKSTTGIAFLSYGHYISRRTVFGLAPGLTIFGSEGSKTESILSLQLFGNVNLAHNKKVIPYFRAVIYKFDLSKSKNEYIQFGGGIKYFFAKRTAWDTLLTYGRGLTQSKSYTVLLLTGLTIIF